MEGCSGGRAADPESGRRDSVHIKEELEDEGALNVNQEPDVKMELEVKGEAMWEGEGVEEARAGLHADQEVQVSLVLEPICVERTTQGSIKSEELVGDARGEGELGGGDARGKGEPVGGEAAGACENELEPQGRGGDGPQRPRAGHAPGTRAGPSPTSGSGDKRTSMAWRYFTILKDLNCKAKCNVCGKIISHKGGGPYNLVRHIKSQHPAALKGTSAAVPPAASCLEPDSSSASTWSANSNDIINPDNELQASQSASPPVPALVPVPTTPHPHAAAPSRLPKVSDNVPKPLTLKKTETINKLLVKLFTKNYLPFSLVESPEFREFVNELNPAYHLPSRKVLSNELVENYYNITKERVKAELARADDVALTTVGWSADPDDKYVAVTAHFIDQEADLKSYTLECARYADGHPAERLAQRLRKICQDWEIERKVVAVTTDNVDDIKVAVTLNEWKQVSCFAHSLNLVVQNALPEIETVHLKVRRIVGLFKRSRLARERLKRMQEKLGEPVVHVKQDAASRWHSTCDMFERTMQMKNSLLSTLASDYPDVPRLTSHDLRVLEKSMEILSFFKEVTEEMSSERNVTISEIIFITNALKNKCVEFLRDVDYVGGLAQKLLDELEERFTSLETDQVLLESTLLDPRLKKHGFHAEYARESALAHLNVSAGLVALSDDAAPPPDLDSGPSPAKKARSIWADFDEKVKEMAKNTSPTSSIQWEIEKYLEESPLPRTQSPLKWWLRKKYIYPRLYSVACRRLCVAATSVPPDLVFSKAGQHITESRNRLTGNKVNRLLFLNKNL